MRYMVIYNNGKLSCVLHDEQTARDFARYMTTKEKHPIAILKIKQFTNNLSTIKSKI